MTTDELKTIIKDALRFNPAYIILSGGEPLLRDDIFELIDFANRLKINTCLTTNGTLLNKDIARRLYGLRVGGVNVSIDGDEDTHDFLRGKGNFRKTLAALENLLFYKIETTVASIVCKQNYQSLASIMELARHFKVNTVKFQPFNQIFLIDKTKMGDFFVSKDDLGKIKQSIEKVIELSRYYKIIINPENYLRSIPAYLCGLWQNSESNCLSLSSSCPISPEGNIYLCWILTCRILGNVRKDSFSNIWNSPEHNRLRRIVMEEGCSGCLMSCYDSNFGKHRQRELFPLQIKKFKQSRFYKRLYFRYYQYLSYLIKKILRRIYTDYLRLRIRKTNGLEIIEKLKEIKLAKDILKNKIDKFI